MSKFKKPMLAGLAAVLLPIAPTTYGAEIASQPAVLDGDYVVAAIRRSNTVESTADAEPNIHDLFGSKASFGDGLTWIDGTICESWTAKRTDDFRINLDELILSDLAIQPLEPSGDSVLELAQSIDLYCDDNDLVPVANVLRVDDRILAIVSAGGSFNLLLEKPLSEKQIKKLQEQLKDMKFYGGMATGVMDEATRSAVAHYADYRGAEYIFKDVVITVNLLDGLGVLEEE